MLLCDATFARDGVLKYVRPDGTERIELRLPEENQKALTSFGLAPLTIEHPPVLLNEDNAESYRKGVSLQNVQYGKGGFVQGTIALMDSEAVRYATQAGGAEISAGYTCDLEEKPGVWKGQNYDAIQRNIRVNHIALTKKGRAGPDVCLHLDSADADIAYQIYPSTLTPRMATLRIDAAEYEVPETIAPILGAKLKRLDALEIEVQESSEKLETLEDQVDEITDERDRERGRADATEICLTNAEIILDSLGYRRDASGDYIRTDMKGKKHHHTKEEDDEVEEMEMAEGDEGDDIPAFMEKKIKTKKTKKMDAAEVRTDAKALMVALKEADGLVPNFSETHFDSVDTVADVRRLVVAELRPNLKNRLDSMSEGTIDGIYDFLIEEGGSREDARSSYRGELSTVVALSKGPQSTPLRNAQESRSQETSNAWTEPLSLSRQ